MSVTNASKTQQSQDALQARIAELEAENERLKAKGQGRITFKVSAEKKCLSIYGLNGRWPVNMYASQAERLLGPAASEPCAKCSANLGELPALKRFIREHRSDLAWKDGAK